MSNYYNHIIKILTSAPQIFNHLSPPISKSLHTIRKSPLPQCLTTSLLLLRCSAPYTKHSSSPPRGRAKIIHVYSRRQPASQPKSVSQVLGGCGLVSAVSELHTDEKPVGIIVLYFTCARQKFRRTEMQSHGTFRPLTTRW